MRRPARTVDQPITLDLHKVPMKEALRAIAKQSGVVLFYNDHDIPAERRVSVTIANATVADALRMVLRGTGLAARATAAGIVIERRKAPAKTEPRERHEQQGAIHGRVTDSKTGEGIGGANVTIEGTGLGVISGDSGAYRIGGVAPGQYTVTAKRLGYERASQEVVVADGQDTALDFALSLATTMLDQVVVTGTVVPTEVKAVPSPVSVITADQIARQHPLTLTSVLRQAVPTAVAGNAPNIPANTSVSVRGASSLTTGGSAMKIFIDGVEASSFSFTPVDVQSIDRIEVVRGPEAATMYGAEAARGLIQIFTKRGDKSQAQTQVGATKAVGVSQTPYAGFENVLRQQYSGSVRGSGENVSYNFGGGYTSLADYAPQNGTTRQSAPSAYGGVKLSNGILMADVSARYYENNIPVVLNPLLATTGYAAGSPPLNRLSTFTNQTVGARITATPATWWRNQLTVGVDRRGSRDVQTQPLRVTADDTLLYLRNNNARKLSVGYHTTMSGAKGTSLSGSLTLGIDHYTQDVSNVSTSQALNTEGTIRTAGPGAFNESLNTVTNTGYYAQAQLAIWDALFITGGVRAEENTTFGADYGTAVLPRIGVAFVQPVGTVTAKVRASYGKALRAPRSGEASRIVTPTGTQLANPDLKPERQEGWDGGVDLIFGSRASLSVSGFKQTARDLISFLSVSGTTSQFRNIGRVSNKGIEVEGTLGLVPWLQLQGQYGYVRSRVEAVGAAGGPVEVGDETLGVPTQTGGLSLTAAPLEGTTLSMGVTYVGSSPDMDYLALYRCLATFTADACPASFLSTFSFRAFNTRYPSFAKVNATVAHRFTRQFEMFVSADNLTNNESYEAGNSLPVMGRTTMVGVHLTY
jgi:outer membrane receptor protein involved in Fe transport